jgi:signal transduction histidine kinase
VKHLIGCRKRIRQKGVMHNNETERTILEIRRSLAQASAHLSPHASKIRSSWSKMLERYECCRPHASSLSELHLSQRVRDLRAVDPRAYREESERHGLELARQGVPAECTTVAVALYVESCFPHLMIDSVKTIKWRRALNRWASIYQFFLLTGYTRNAADEREVLEERTALAERRSHEFSAELGDAYEKERRRLAQDLHDEIGHDLIVLKLYMQVMALDVKQGDVHQLRRKLKECVSVIKHALNGVRHLVFDLGPAVWNEQGFIPAVRLYTRQFATRTGLKVHFSAHRLKTTLPARYETALYKVLQGALANVAAHANAGNVRITLGRRRDLAVMTIEDDGKGFNVGKKLKTPPKSFGLRAMHDRIELLGGTIHFTSSPARRGAAGRGTVIELLLPMHPAEKT